ncbi:hypothetical protein [Ruegeria sp. HKCCA5491]|uniref:hypothetical protein n=1 Tax=Ruegeria sp. HKCCA5491 TaxID=2682986 RepID=UPI001489632D|nr:hypothetical protein [Ruegeria sp. HKCCA5491]
MRSVLVTVVALVFLAGSLAGPRPSAACPVCITLPEYSLADRILSARVIVLAAPALDNPFSYSPVSILKGTAKQLSALPEIPFLVDSVTRSAFRTDPGRRVLIIYGAGYPDKAGRSLSMGWIKGFLMTPERANFVEAIRHQGASWAFGKTDDPSRVAFFGSYLGHEDALLRNAALIEFHRAPYAMVRQLRDQGSSAALLQELRSVNRLAYAPAVIRLLGLQSDPAAKAAVRTRYQQALASGDTNLYDWALAGIEVDGAAAITAIEASLKQQSLSQDMKRDLVRALTDAGTARSEFQTQILDIFKRELQQNSPLAVWIALAAKSWETDILNSELRSILSTEQLEPAAQFLIENTLVQFEQN